MKFRYVAWGLVLCALAACNNEKPRKLIDQRVGEANEYMKEARDNPGPKKSYNPLRVSDKVWAGGVSLRMSHGLPLPGRFEGQHGIAIISAENMSLHEIAAAVGAQTGIPVRLTGGLSGRTSSASLTAAKDASATIEDGMPVSYEGSLSGLLDLVSSSFGVNWRYDGASVNVSRYETRVFVIEALPGKQTVKDGVKEDENTSSGSSNTMTGGGGSYTASNTSSLKQSSSMDVEIKVWEELEKTVTAMINNQGSVVISPSSGTITVMTTPENMATIAHYIEEENKRLSQQVAINVEIYTVSLAEGTDFSVSFNTALKRLSDLGGNISSATAPSVGSAAGITGGGFTVPGNLVTNGAGLGVAILNPKHDGAVNMLFSALSSIGNATRVAQFPMTTLNNRPVTRRIGRDRTYIAEVSSSSSLSSSTNSITPGTIREGFSVQLTPRVLDDGRIMLQYSFSLTDIVQMRTASLAETQSIELPETSSRVFVQQAMLKSGSTLLIGGFDDEQTSLNTQGVGNPFNYLLGGGSSNSVDRTMLFIGITPQVLDVPRGDQDQ